VIACSNAVRDGLFHFNFGVALRKTPKSEVSDLQHHGSLQSFCGRLQTAFTIIRIKLPAKYLSVKTVSLQSKKGGIVAVALKSVQIHLEGVGPVLLEKTAKAKYMRISIRPEKGVRVSLPLRGSFDQAEAFVREKLSWIRHHQEKLALRENPQTIFSETTFFQTFRHTLKIAVHGQPEVKAKLKAGFLEVLVPGFRPVSDPDIQQAIRHAVEETYRHEAKVFMPERVAFFAQKFGLKYAKVTIKKAGTRWGSCSYTNNINLNLHLMRLPERLRDYVILHELAHTVEKNHGPRFWALLETICPNSRALDNEMKAYRIGIY
jgi:predicted metal-dependent hydrolase